ncbi:acetyl-CoA carboxylase biotin carboxyl carrier protein subunit [Hydrocarboniphaga sp.]|uniref:acetyl-CoA carboxylase biotin carboxyl carrier protein subunit n=1 Tax=Hydrocarboniphaga sp. TaxID=2033016 RepID=UPI002ABCCBF7|nr:biotin/lipoyl-containing protein [Hydrocarboniphaga sp.]MDZ4077940.1 biotin/lipoyl-containing protein [Hydrocarboniphaga sp.]
MLHALKIADTEHSLALSRAPQGYRLHLADQTLSVALRQEADGAAWLQVGDRHLRVHVATRGDQVFVHLDGEAYELRYRHPLDRLAAQSAGSADDSVIAPMPGSVVALSVAIGDAVAKGQVLMVMESMKMETTLVAPRDGVIAAITYAKGQSFDRDAVLLSLEPSESKSTS